MVWPLGHLAGLDRFPLERRGGKIVACRLADARWLHCDRAFLLSDVCHIHTQT